MNALVTGATGFVGGHLCERLVRTGANVRALARVESDTTRLPREVEVVRGDLEDHPSLSGLMEGRDVVFHLAAARSPGTYGHTGRRETDVEGTASLAELAAEGRARFVFASSRGVHGAVDGILDAQTPVQPNTPYRRVKAEAEQALSSLASRANLEHVTLRIPSVVGRGAYGWLGLYKALATGRFRLIGSGRNRVHPCPVEDVVQALLLAGTANDVGGEIFIFSGCETASLREFIELMAGSLDASIARVGIPSFPYRLRGSLGRFGRTDTGLSPYEMFLVSYEIDNDAARAGLGYDPRVRLADAVQSMTSWYRETGLLD